MTVESGLGIRHVTEATEPAGAVLHRQQRTMELCAAVMRSLSGHADLHFRDSTLYSSTTALPMLAPHLHPNKDGLLLEDLRGVADGMGLRIRHSDSMLHRGLCPTEPARMMVFEMLEQFRVESLSDPEMPGILSNLNHRFEQWSLEFSGSTLFDTRLGMVIFAVAQVCRAKITGVPRHPDFEDRIESTWWELAPLLGGHVAALRSERNSQRNFAIHALAVAETVATRIDHLEIFEKGPSRRRSPSFQLVFPQESSWDNFPVAGYESGHAFGAESTGYRCFTRAYDRELVVANLIRAALLGKYRQQLDDSIAKQNINVRQLGRRLAAVLSSAAPDGWAGDALEGRLDASRLTRLVTSPGEPRIFRTDRIESRSDARVAFLVDCSGSMKEHSSAVAVLVDIYARALELAGIRCEVLGFTTGSWNGGRAWKDWISAERPEGPGRLNEVRHLVFKDSWTPWRHARPAIAGLMRKELFREGVDGEAIDWACRRLVDHSDRRRSNEESDGSGRRILMVLSDGSPMDSATALANGDHYLEQHLRSTVRSHTDAGDVEIFGLGVGLDLSPYYPRNTALDLSQGTSARIINQVLNLLRG